MKHWRELSRGQKIFDLVSVLLPLPLLLLYLRDPARYPDPSGIEKLFALPLALSFLIGLVNLTLALAGRRPKGEWWSILLGISLFTAASLALFHLFALVWALQFLVGAIASGR